MVLLFFEVSIVDENGRVHGRIKREIDRDAAYIGNRAVEEMQLGVMPGGMDAVVQMMRVREFRKGLLEDAAKMAGRQLAEILEDREGWHGLDRADSAEAQGMTMTSEQIELARHALGLPNREKRSYRNHYVGEHAAWEAMVAAGLARKSSGSPLSGGDIVYWLTKPAAEAALSKGERLDPEDFPARMADNANPK